MAAMPLHPLMRDRAAELSPVAARLFERSIEALGREDLVVAEPLLIELLALAPECAEVLRVCGLGKQMRGNSDAAEVLLRQALSLRPRDALIRMNLGTALCSREEFAQAKSLLQGACELAPDFAPAWFNLGRMFQIQGRHGGAIPVLFRALDLNPEHIPARLVLAEAQTGFGALAEARVSYREVLRRESDNTHAWLGLAQLPEAHFAADDAPPLRRAVQRAESNPAARATLGFALAQALEQAGDYSAAFRALRKANALRRRQLPWHAASAHAYVEHLLEAFATPLHGADEDLGAQVILLTSLAPAEASATLQVLTAHARMGEVAAASDLQQVLDDESERRARTLPQWVALATPADWSRLGRDYLARTRRCGDGKSCFVDVSSFNWLLLGAARAMLPAARVLELRRDPLETCFACYRQGFAHGHAFSYDLDSVAACYRDYARLCRHWQAVFAERYLVQDEASLRLDRAAQTSRLLAFCGLDPDPACMSFSLPPALDHAARYGSALNQLRALLGTSAAG